MSIAPETKSAVPAADASRAFDEFARAFEAFKDTNDSRLSRIETRLSGDVVTEEKLARIGDVLDEHTRRIDRVTLDARRPALAGAADARDPAVAEHKAAFDLYVRAGEAAGLKRREAKALSAGSGPDGGYLVPDTIEREVLRRLSAISPIRAIASVRTISGGLYKRAFSTTGVSAGWIGETAARPQTNAATLAELSSSTTPSSTSSSGSRRKSRPPSPSRRAPPSSTATASASRRASSPPTRSTTAPGYGASSASCRPAMPAPSRP